MVHYIPNHLLRKRGEEMATVIFTSTVKANGAIVVPKEALMKLGILSGEEVEVRVEVANSVQTAPVMLGEMLKDLLDEIETLEPETKIVYNDPHEKAYGEVLLDKYRKMGLKL